MKNKWPIFIISLPDALVRQQSMNAQLRELGLDNSIFLPAIRGAALSNIERAQLYDDFRVRTHAGRSMTAGELGCALSHLKCYDHIVANDAQWSVVLEDDAVLPSDFAKAVDDFILRSAALGVDILSLGPIRKFIKKPGLKVNETYDLVTPIRVWNAHAYIISRDAANKLARLNRPVSYMADDWISFQRKASISIGGVDPYICSQQEETKHSGLEVDRRKVRGRSYFDVLSFSYFIGGLCRRFLEIKKSIGMKVYTH